MKGKRVISALCGFAMLLTGFGLTSTTAVADDGKLDQQVVTQDVGGGDSQQKSGEGVTTDSGDNEPQGDSSVKDKTPEDENPGISVRRFLRSRMVFNMIPPTIRSLPTCVPMSIPVICR